MPTYEYECQKCKKHHDIMQNITAKALTKCPSCSGKMKRLMGSGSGFIFKGSGFYITDYRSKSYKEGEKKEQSASGGSGSGSNDKSGGGSGDKSSGGSGSGSTDKPSGKSSGSSGASKASSGGSGGSKGSSGSGCGGGGCAPSCN